jgi:hypothetical protein
MVVMVTALQVAKVLARTLVKVPAKVIAKVDAKDAEIVVIPLVVTVVILLVRALVVMAVVAVHTIKKSIDYQLLTLLLIKNSKNNELQIRKFQRQCHRMEMESQKDKLIICSLKKTV